MIRCECTFFHCYDFICGARKFTEVQFYYDHSAVELLNKVRVHCLGRYLQQRSNSHFSFQLRRRNKQFCR